MQYRYIHRRKIRNTLIRKQHAHLTVIDALQTVYGGYLIRGLKQQSAAWLLVSVHIFASVRPRACQCIQVVPVCIWNYSLLLRTGLCILHSLVAGLSPGPLKSANNESTCVRSIETMRLTLLHANIWSYIAQWSNNVMVQVLCHYVIQIHWWLVWNSIGVM